MKKVKFGGSLCIPVREAYGSNGNLAIALRDEDTWEPVAIATVNTDEKLAEDMAYIKDYSENQGMLKALREAGLVTELCGYKESGFQILTLAKIDITQLYRKEDEK